MYNKFKQITQIDNNGCQSIFSYLQNKISMIENTELVKVVISIKHYEDSTIIYEFKKGTIIPLSIFKALKLLFTDFKLLDSDFNINLTVNFYNKTYDIDFGGRTHLGRPGTHARPICLAANHARAFSSSVHLLMLPF